MFKFLDYKFQMDTTADAEIQNIIETNENINLLFELNGWMVFLQKCGLDVIKDTISICMLLFH